MSWCHLVGCGCLTDLINIFSNTFSLFQLLQIFNFYKQCWPYIGYHIDIFWNFFINKNLQFWTILLCYRKCVTEKITYVKTLSIGSMPSPLTVFLSIPFNKLPWRKGRKFRQNMDCQFFNLLSCIWRLVKAANPVWFSSRLISSSSQRLTEIQKIKHE